MASSRGRTRAQELQESAQLERLAEPAGCADFLRALRGVRSSGHDDERSCSAVSLTERRREFPAVEDRHPHVEEDESGQLSARVDGVESLAPVRGNLHLVAFAL